MIFSFLNINIREANFSSFYNLDKQQISCTLSIEKLEKEGTTNNCYKAKILTIDNKKKLSSYTFVYIKKNIFLPQSGDVLAVTGTFNLLESSRNYMGFDYRQSSKKDGICGSIYADKVAYKKASIDVSIIFEKIKSNIKEHICKVFNSSKSGLICGLVLGDSYSIESLVLENFRNIGIAHILAVSGTHISYIILGIGLLFKHISIGKRKTNIILIVILVLYMLIIGDLPSVIRAVIMSVMLLISSLLHRKADTLNCLNISAIIQLVYNPYFLFDTGFLLSFSGVLGIVFIYPLLSKIFNSFFSSNKVFKYIKELVLICISVQIFILPISLYFFNSFNALFIISNLLIVPIARYCYNAIYFNYCNIVFFNIYGKNISYYSWNDGRLYGRGFK